MSGRILGRKAALSALAVVTAALVLPPAAQAVPAPEIRTFVGPSVAAMYPSGLEVDNANGRLVVANTPMDEVLLYSQDGHRLRSFGGFGTTPGRLQTPRDVAVDTVGNIYVADTANDRVQSFTATGGFRWLAASEQYPALRHPMGVTWDVANQQLVVTGTGAGQISGWSRTGQPLWTSPAASVTGIDQPRDAGRAPDGTIWVADYTHDRVAFFTVSPTGRWSAGSPTEYSVREIRRTTSGSGDTRDPYNVAFSPDGRTMYLAATSAQVVSRYDVSKGIAAAVALPPIGTRCPVKPDPCPDPPLPGSAGVFNDLRRVATASDGRVFAADEWGNGIEVFRPDGTPLRSIEGVTAPPPGVARPTAVDVDPTGHVYVIDQVTHRLERFDRSGVMLAARGSRGSITGFFLWPSGVTVAPDGAVWVVDTRNNRLERFSADLSGPVTADTSDAAPIGPMNYPMGGDADAGGRIWIADQGNNRIVVFDPKTSAWSAFGTSGSAPGSFREAQGLAVTNAAVYVADTGNNRIQKLSRAGAPLAAMTGMSRPTGVDVAADGTVWIMDTGHGRVVHADAGLTKILATYGTTGDLDLPHDLAISGNDVYVTDTYHSRVQVIHLAGAGSPTG